MIYLDAVASEKEGGAGPGIDCFTEFLPTLIKYTTVGVRHQGNFEAHLLQRIRDGGCITGGCFQLRSWSKLCVFVNANNKREPLPGRKTVFRRLRPLFSQGLN